MKKFIKFVAQDLNYILEVFSSGPFFIKPLPSDYKISDDLRRRVPKMTVEEAFSRDMETLSLDFKRAIEKRSPQQANV